MAKHAAPWKTEPRTQHEEVCNKLARGKLRYRHKHVVNVTVQGDSDKRDPYDWRTPIY